MDNQKNTSTRDMLLKDLIAQVQNANTKDYLLNRILPQLNWYGKNSKKNKMQYYLWMTVSIVLGAVIPIVSVFADGKTWVKVTIAALGSSVTAINSFIALHNFRDLWITYRKNREIYFELYTAISIMQVFFRKIQHNKKKIFCL